MFARDIMTAEVLTLMPSTSVLDAAQLLVERRIGGAPVVDEAGQVIGIVSEGDLMRRAELGTERSWSGWREFLTAKSTIAQEYVRSHATRVGDIMTAPVWTVEEGAPLNEIAALFEKRNIRRVPVVRDGRMMGIISRADMVRALVRRWAEAHPERELDDEAIRAAVLDRAAKMSWGDTAALNVEVHGGAVELHGITDSEEVAKALVILAETSPGVRSVHSHLRTRGDARIGHAV